MDGLARAYLMAGRFDEAWALASEAVTRLEGAVHLDIALRTRCEVALARGDAATALELGNRIAAMAPEWPIHCLLAVIHMQRDERDEARRAVERAKALHPGLTLDEATRIFSSGAPGSRRQHRPALEAAGLEA